MHRFFIPIECIRAERVEFPEDTSHQIARVLRLKHLEQVVVLDNRGLQYAVQLESVTPRSVSGIVLEKHLAEGEAKTDITLYLGLTQREKFEWILQKATELGVTGFVPLITQRSLVQSGDETTHKQERWQRIIREAAEQSGRGRCPDLFPIQKLERLIPLKHEMSGFVLWEEEESLGFKSALKTHAGHSLALLVGPEGGLTTEEVGVAQLAGFTPVSLGKRILRMETAAIVAAAVTLFERGDMEPGV